MAEETGGEKERQYIILFSGGSQCTLQKKIKEKENYKLSQYLYVSPKPASFKEYLASKVAQIQSKHSPFLELTGKLLYQQILGKAWIVWITPQTRE